ncbi:MAG: tRNA lysidine(34) synthetase TilS [Burkholderiales bacterium]|nr:tRNA lysidine(34) synthetase TilS [Burkholderiales bacterium]
MLPRVAVAASGGRDSTALLHCTARAASALGAEVVALHVHHGLQAEADDWLELVRRQARRWGAEFACQRLLGKPVRGASVEAWARTERYRALAELAHATGCGLVLLAHHRRDQAETWLLQALRGAGAPGLAAMPARAEREGLTWVRPWLDQPRDAIEAYVRRHRLRHAEDPSNADPRYARNRLRLQVWPALTAAFPDAEAALAAAAAQAQDAAALAAQLATQDLARLGEGPALRVEPWLALPAARRRNALRAWLARAAGRGCPETLVERLEAELPGAQAARWPGPGIELRLYRGLLGAASAPTSNAAYVKDTATGPSPDLPAITLDLSRPGRHPVPAWRGHFEVRTVTQGGAAPALLRALEARPRTGGERFRLAPRATPRSLKKQFQAQGVAAADREGPLLYAGARLLYVPGLGIEATLQAPADTPQLELRWVGGGGTGQRQPPG